MVKSNFSFLNEICPYAAESLIKAEKYYALYEEDIISIELIRKSIDSIVNYIIKYEQLDINLRESIYNKLKSLEYYNCIPNNVLNLMHEIRKERNSVYYEHISQNKETIYYFISIFNIAKWLCYKYEDIEYMPEKFIDPKIFYSNSEKVEKNPLKKSTNIYYNESNAILLSNNNVISSNYKKKSNNNRQLELRSIKIAGDLQENILRCMEFFQILNHKFIDIEDSTIIDIEPTEVTNNIKINKKTYWAIFTSLTLILITIISLYTFKEQINKQISIAIADSITKTVTENTSNETSETQENNHMNETINITEVQNLNSNDEKTAIDNTEQKSKIEDSNILITEVETDIQKLDVSFEDIKQTSSEEVIETIKELPYIIGIKTDKLSPQDVGTHIKFHASLTNNDEVNFKFDVKNINSEVWNNIGNNNDILWTPQYEGSYIIRVSIYDISNNLIDKYECNYLINEKPTGWIYFTNDNKSIYKMRTNGNDLLKISNVKAFNLEVYNDWIYFLGWDDACIYKVRTNGDDLVRVVSDCSLIEFNSRNKSKKSFFIRGNYLYYLGNGGKSINQICLDNSEIQEIIKTDDHIQLFDVEEKFVYLVSDDDFAVYDIETSDYEVLDFADGWTNIRAYNGYAYHVYKNRFISKIKNDGSINGGVCNGSDHFIFENNYLYAIDNDSNAYLSTLDKYDLEGNQERVLYEWMTYAFDIEDGWAYFTTDRDFRKIKIDGTKETKINDLQPYEILVVKD
jgi:hypothetical protein